MLDISRKKDYDDKKFLAGVNGVDLEDNSNTEDVIELQGRRAQQDGFGINEGLGYVDMGE